MGTINGGMTLKLTPITKYDFSSLKASGTVAQVLCQHVDVSNYTEAELEIRFHAGTSMPTGTSLSVQAYEDGWSSEDPAAVFSNVNNAGGTAFANYAVPAASAFPLYQILNLPVPTGRLINLYLVAQQPVSPLGLIALLSVDIVVKGGDMTGAQMGPNTYLGYRPF